MTTLAEELEKAAPTYRQRKGVRFLLRRIRWLDNNNWVWRSDTCVYCGRKARHKSLYVNPFTLRRQFADLCNRRSCNEALREYEHPARQRRAWADWHREHPRDPAELLRGYPMQYPSLSRATLRAFMEGDQDSATVVKGQGVTAQSLNSSIKALGFEGEVYAEVRSDHAVLRKAEVL